MELLSVQEAATRAGVTSKAIYYSLSHGKLTAHKKYGRVLVDASEISRYKPRSRNGESAVKSEKSGNLPEQSKRLLALLNKWMDEDPEYDKQAYELLRKTMAENPITFREYKVE